MLRKYNGTDYPTPWLTLSRELDGLQRPIRVAQGYYHCVNKKNMSQQPETDTPVLIVKGMNHMLVSNRLANMPILPRTLDLAPEITRAEAHNQVSARLSAFVHYHFSGTDRENRHTVLSRESFLSRF